MRSRQKRRMMWAVAGVAGGFTIAAGASFSLSACGSRTGLDAPLVVERETPDGSLVRVDASGVLPDVGTRPPLDCAEAGITYIYAVAQDNSVYSFYPTTGEFTFIGTIDCPAPLGAEPFSMAVDHTGVAYVVFSNRTIENGVQVILPGDGDIFRVSTKTAACEATPFVAGQHGFRTFGMGFVATTDDAGVAGETLFVAGDETSALATIDTKTFELTEVAPIGSAGGMPVTMAELTGTGDGRLFGFFAPITNEAPSFIVQIDPKTAQVTSNTLLPDVVEGGGWAFGFWGGDFYTFTFPVDATVVTRYRPSDGTVVPVATAPLGVEIVGAGVSTCAPQH
jgi:hypothetical protein